MSRFSPLKVVWWRGQGALWNDVELYWPITGGRFIGPCGHRIETPAGIWRQKTIFKECVPKVESREDSSWRSIEQMTLKHSQCSYSSCPYFNLWSIGFTSLKILIKNWKAFVLECTTAVVTPTRLAWPWSRGGTQTLAPIWGFICN